MTKAFGRTASYGENMKAFEESLDAKAERDWLQKLNKIVSAENVDFNYLIDLMHSGRFNDYRIPRNSSIIKQLIALAMQNHDFWDELFLYSSEITGNNEMFYTLRDFGIQNNYLPLMHEQAI